MINHIQVAVFQKESIMKSDTDSLQGEDQNDVENNFKVLENYFSFDFWIRITQYLLNE